MASERRLFRRFFCLFVIFICSARARSLLDYRAPEIVALDDELRSVVSLTHRPHK
jgi:hypothetical protein